MPECGVAGAADAWVSGAFAREGPGQGDGGQFRLPGEHSLHQQFPAHDEHCPFPFSEEPGIPGRVYAHLWTGGTLFSDLLLGHGFVLASCPVEGMEDVLSRDGMYLYRLPGAQWGRVVPESALGLELDDKASVFENLNVLYARLFPSGKSPLYVPAEARTEVCGNAYSMRIPERDGDVYGFPLTDTDELKVDGREVPVMAEAQKKPGWKGRTYNGTLELKSAVTGGETLVTGVMRRLVECPMIVAAAQQGEWDLPAFPEGSAPRRMEERGRGGHVEVTLPPGQGRP